MRCQVFLFLLGTSLLITNGSLLQAADETESYPDKAGREALKHWENRERNRAVEEAARRYWDYWFSQSSLPSSAADLWYNLEQTQKWLKDPENVKPPPPPPLPPPVQSYPYLSNFPYLYPYPYFYQPYYMPYFNQIPLFIPSTPYYSHPGLPGKKGE